MRFMPMVMLAPLILAACAQIPVAYEATTRLPVYERRQAHRQLIVTIREAEVSLSASPGSSPRTYENSARYQPSPYARRIADEIAHDYDLTWLAEWRIDVLGVHCVVFTAPDREARERALQRLRNDRRVESVQPMHEFRTASRGSAPAAAVQVAKSMARSEAYNDPYFALQRQVESIRVPEAQRWAKGRGVRVAVIDTGVDLHHPELAGRVSMARNFVDDDDKTFSRDAHGTAVVGLIAAAVNNGLGIIGVAPSIELLVLKACWHPSPNEAAVCNTLTLAEALASAIENKAAVINLSLGGPDDSLLRRLVEAAIRRGVIVVGADAGPASAGRSFPLAVEGVLAVADGDVAPALKPHARIAAPGHEVLTLAPLGRYDYFSGASLSSAMVSGIVALLLEHRRGISPKEMATLLERTAFPLAAASAPATSAGSLRVVDACRAVAAVMQSASCVDRAPRVAGVRSKESM